MIGYLTDVDFVKFFRRCQIGLKSGGFIVIKDNMFNGFVLVCGGNNTITKCIGVLLLLCVLIGLSINHAGIIPACRWRRRR